MNDIKILRLTTGEDIIGHVTSNDFGFVVEDPMMLRVNYRGNNPQGVLQLAYWLPVELIKSNSATVQFEHVITVLDPDDSFMEYYINAIQKVKELMDAKNNMDDMDIMDNNDIMDIMDSIKMEPNQILH